MNTNGRMHSGAMLIESSTDRRRRKDCRSASYRTAPHRTQPLYAREMAGDDVVRAIRVTEQSHAFKFLSGTIEQIVHAQPRKILLKRSRVRENKTSRKATTNIHTHDACVRAAACAKAQRVPDASI